MRILRNVLLMVVPILLMINLYRFVFYNDEYTFRGFAYMHQYFSTFPGLNLTFTMLQRIQSTSTSFQTIKVESLLDVFDAINKVFEMIGLVFSVPIMIVVDVVRDILWAIGIFATN